jgi:hypothetical protein
MGDELLDDAVRQHAQRRLGRLEGLETALEEAHRQRSFVQSLYSGPGKKPDKPGKKAPPKVTPPPAPDPKKKGIGTGTPPTVHQPSVTPKTPKIASQGGLRAQMTKLMDRAKLNAIPLGKQLAKHLPRFLAGLDALFSLLDGLEAIETATSLYAHGTALPKEQQEADEILRQSVQAKREADAATEDINLMDWGLLVHAAVNSDDDTGLYAIDAGITQIREALEASVNGLEGMANDLYQRARPLEKASGEQLIAVYMPSLSTTANAMALAMHESLKQLNNTLRAAAANYKETSETLAWWTTQLRRLEVLATEAAWDIRVERRAQQLKGR